MLWDVDLVIISTLAGDEGALRRDRALRQSTRW
jgi:hypothetical protein